MGRAAAAMGAVMGGAAADAATAAAAGAATDAVTAAATGATAARPDSPCRRLFGRTP